ncbi:MAG: divalent-cation tolerance protein CutA [Acidobacteriia bacterium]|nr:divalent-cation tolerance protein CutA [Terriglobia bacterium]
MTDKRIVLTTAGTREEAGKIARALVERRLAACVNVVAIESVYRWTDKVENAQEWLLLVKTTAGAFDDVDTAIRELHSYELPECVALLIEGGNEEYLEWIGENVGIE